VHAARIDPAPATLGPELAAAERPPHRRRGGPRRLPVRAGVGAADKSARPRVDAPEMFPWSEAHLAAFLAWAAAPPSAPRWPATRTRWRRWLSAGRGTATSSCPAPAMTRCGSATRSPAPPSGSRWPATRAGCTRWHRPGGGPRHHRVRLRGSHNIDTTASSAPTATAGVLTLNSHRRPPHPSAACAEGQI